MMKTPRPLPPPPWKARAVGEVLLPASVDVEPENTHFHLNSSVPSSCILHLPLFIVFLMYGAFALINVRHWVCMATSDAQQLTLLHAHPSPPHQIFLMS